MTMRRVGLGHRRASCTAARKSLGGGGDPGEVAVRLPRLGDGAAHADAGDARREPLLDVLRRHAACGHDRQVRQRREHGLGVRDARVLGREQLDDVRTRLGRLEYLGRGERPADRRHLVAVRDADHLGVELRADQERRAGADALVRGVAIEHGPRSHRDALRRVLRGQSVDEVDGSRDGQRDLQRAEPAFDRGVRDALRGVRVRQPNDEDGTGLFDRAAVSASLVNIVSLLVEKTVIDRLSHAPYRHCNRSQQPISATDSAIDLSEGSVHGSAGDECCPARPTGRSSGWSDAGAATAEMGDAIRAARSGRWGGVLMSRARTIVLGASHWHVPLYAATIAEVHEVVGLSDDDPDRVRRPCRAVGRPGRSRLAPVAGAAGRRARVRFRPARPDGRDLPGADRAAHPVRRREAAGHLARAAAAGAARRRDNTVAAVIR